MKKYAEDEILIFLEALNKHLSKKTELILIGGTAAVLAYHVSLRTKDVDTVNSISEIAGAIKKANSATGLNVIVETVGVYDAPYEWESRQIILPLKLDKLIVKVPEIHDLILMKTVRCFEHDLAMIDEMCHKNSVKSTVLLTRYMKEMKHLIMPQNKIRLNFLAMIERCFDKKVLKKVEVQISKSNNPVEINKNKTRRGRK
ncbi:MAG: DUF6036 family nucleotidyltransferase [Bdellovibrionales bacterium]